MIPGARPPHLEPSTAAGSIRATNPSIATMSSGRVGSVNSSVVLHATPPPRCSAIAAVARMRLMSTTTPPLYSAKLRAIDVRGRHQREDVSISRARRWYRNGAVFHDLCVTAPIVVRRQGLGDHPLLWSSKAPLRPFGRSARLRRFLECFYARLSPRAA